MQENKNFCTSYLTAFCDASDEIVMLLRLGVMKYCSCYQIYIQWREVMSMVKKKNPLTLAYMLNLWTDFFQIWSVD